MASLQQVASCAAVALIACVQAPLQLSTAACARQGRMGQDQVRDLGAFVRFGSSQLLADSEIHHDLNLPLVVLFTHVLSIQPIMH
jgi:hypothetical protein